MAKAMFDAEDELTRLAARRDYFSQWFKTSLEGIANPAARIILEQINQEIKKRILLEKQTVGFQK